mmetsp:Transcript_33241/g.67062  ORF Transcript_33241/g.67062 Transcript_33241/m.67062 type:complete len:99 (+) Transcript_33241:79-375(+)
MSSGGFGSWNYDQKQQDGGDLESGGGGGDNGGSETSSFLGASGVAIPEGMSWSNFKSSLESQMPQRVMGMNYQERFKVSTGYAMAIAGSALLTHAYYI